MYACTLLQGIWLGHMVLATVSLLYCRDSRFTSVYPSLLSRRLISYSSSIVRNEVSPSISHRFPASSASFTFPSPAIESRQFVPSHQDPYMMRSRLVNADIHPSDASSKSTRTNSTSSTMALITPTSLWVKEEEEDRKLALFGDLPEEKRRKFILLDDQARGCRVRVRVLLDNVKMEEMPDSHLRANSVHPRSYYPRQMKSPSLSPGQPGNWDDAEDSSDDEAETANNNATDRSGTRVRVPLVGGSHATLHIPRLTKGRRARECALNELGYRMSWSQAKTFNARPIFLQKACKFTGTLPVHLGSDRRIILLIKLTRQWTPTAIRCAAP